MAEGITVEGFVSGDGAWEMARRAPHPVLRGGVGGYTGYWEETPGPLRRREAPSGVVPLIISFGAPITVTRPGAPPRRLTSFAGGLSDGPALTEHDGRQHGVQVNLTPLGAYRLFGRPMRDLANETVDLAEVLGPRAGELAGRLAEAPGWARRFALLDDALARRMLSGPQPCPEVVWTWRRLVRTAGRARIADLAHEVARSPRYLVGRFDEQVGLPPKTVARTLRFRRAAALALRGMPLAEVAARCGYVDQPHLNREFRSLAGCTPAAYRAATKPDTAGVLA